MAAISSHRSPMIGLLVAAHGTLGESLIQCATYVLGKPPEQMLALDLMAYRDTEAMLAAANDAIHGLDQGEGVLILTDLYGATPSNTVCKLIQCGRVEVVSGVNLPMLLKVLNYRTETLTQLLARATRGGQDGIFQIEMCRCDA